MWKVTLPKWLSNKKSTQTQLPTNSFRWIPVSERLPNKIGAYFTTVYYWKRAAHGKREFTKFIVQLNYTTKGWDIDPRHRVVAWIDRYLPFELSKTEKESLSKELDKQ